MEDPDIDEGLLEDPDIDEGLLEGPDIDGGLSEDSDIAGALLEDLLATTGGLSARLMTSSLSESEVMLPPPQTGDSENRSEDVDLKRPGVQKGEPDSDPELPVVGVALKS